MHKFLRSLISAIAAIILTTSCVFQTPVDGDAMMELPALEEQDIVISHIGYTISYDARNLIPEWVAYELTAEETSGSEDRGDRYFSMDPDLRKRQAMREDYSGSGWTKGHMAPAADFRWSGEAMDETFYLTNICPQDKDLNAGDWAYLEKSVRKWARKYGCVWVVSGPVIGENIHGKIGERNVTVPDAFFKAVLAYTGSRYSAIGFVMGNDDRRYYLRDCAVTIDYLEDLTGFDFFPELDDQYEEVVESAMRFDDWNIK
ncbi:MAG: DNA/RNA non-specific endonuclease [Bacteroidales bacterium]|nr:DNA/RNA non-specific endonuclease [Bacteroidales bacterium]